MTMGRPSCPIDRNRLEGLREERKLTQRALACAAYKLLDRPMPDSQDMETNYQRVLRKGSTSFELARALAQVLGTTVGVLQGTARLEPPPDRVDELEEQLRSRLAAGRSPALMKALEEHADAYNSERELASDLAGRIEAAQLSQRSEELAQLSELTGWSTEQLLQPLSMFGYWLFCDPLGSSRSAKIVGSAQQALSRIEERMDSLVGNRHCSDLRIVLKEEAPWFRVTVEGREVPLGQLTYSFVRCVPEPSGLRYSTPTWWERETIEAALKEMAFRKANFVVGLDGRSRPGDERQLRLLVEAVDPTTQRFLPVTVVEGALEELEDERLDRFRRDGQAHDLVTNWLALGLPDALKEPLGRWPMECWKVQSSTHIELGVSASAVMALGGKPPPFGPQCVVRLVEQDESGQLHLAPWRLASVALVAKQLQRAMNAP